MSDPAWREHEDFYWRRPRGTGCRLVANRKPNPDGSYTWKLLVNNKTHKYGKARRPSDGMHFAQAAYLAYCTQNG